jgi:hypothetical protein
MTAIKVGAYMATLITPRNSVIIQARKVLGTTVWGNPFFQRIGINFKTAK